MAEENSGIPRFLSGEITRCHLGKPGRYDQYGVHIEGVYEDTKEEVDAYFNSKYPVPVYEGDESPIDANEADGLKFVGRIMITQKQYEGKTYSFLNAVSIEKRMGEDESFQDQGNPFLANPL